MNSKDAKMEAAAAEIAAALKDHPDVQIVLPLHVWVVLIAHVQLALRHPRARGDSSRLAEQTVRQLIDALPEPLRPHMMAGFDRAQDLMGDDTF